MKPRVQFRILLGVLAGLSMHAPLRAQTQHPLLDPIRGRTYVGVAKCVGCHNSSTEPTVNLPGGGNVKDDFCLMQEVGVIDADPHVQAWKQLDPARNAYARQMWTTLGGEGDVTAFWLSRNCLTCHSGAAPDATEPPDGHIYGVSCETCHGPAAAWLDPHTRPDSWRIRLPNGAQGKTSTGFIDVRNPITKSRLCYSCHIGDVALGRVVTHEMYAAGHPPLPGIEVEAFGSSLPRHWRSADEKGPFENKAEYLRVNPGTSSMPRLRTTLIGAVVALRQTVALGSEQAARNEAWPEFAVFDCAACHHDLRTDSWRQARGFDGLPPGRPTIFSWPRPLAELAAAQSPKSYDDELRQYMAAVRARPFGDRAQMAQTSTDLIAKLDAIAADLLTAELTPERANRVKTSLTELLGEATAKDYHSQARIQWALRSLELGEHAGDRIGSYSELRKPKLDRPILSPSDPRRADTPAGRRPLGYPPTPTAPPRKD